ncbi:MAG: CorA family divalent cation transporter [Devosia sp.]
MVSIPTPDFSARKSVSGVVAALVLDGKGGIVAQEPGAPLAETPPGGFAIVAGNARTPDFKVWLRNELGEFHAGLLSAPSSRARCTVLDRQALLMFRVVRPGAAPEDVGRQIITLWLEEGRVVIASEINIVELLGIGSAETSRHAPVSPADLVARLSLKVTDRLEPLIEVLGDRLDEIEETLITHRTEHAQDRLEQLRRTLINLRRLVWPQRDALSALEMADLPFLSDRDRQRLREAAMRTARLGDELQSLSERAVLVHEEIIDERSEQMNHTMLLLAAVTVVFSPLTLITGLLGMNVAGIPFADSAGAFWLVCAGLVAVVGGIIWWMRRRHLL